MFIDLKQLTSKDWGKILSEETYNNVVAAKDAYETWQDSEDTYADAVDKQKDTEKGKTQDLLKIKEIKLDLIELEKDDSLTSKEKNKLITEELKTKKEIFGFFLILKFATYNILLGYK